MPNRKKKTIKNDLQKHGTHVEVVMMDMMSPSFKAAVRKALGKFVIVADRFHFCRYIYWALDGVRRRIQSEWNDYDQKKCKRMRVFKGTAKLTEEDRWYLDRYLGWKKSSQGLLVEKVLPLLMFSSKPRKKDRLRRNQARIHGFLPEGRTRGHS